MLAFLTSIGYEAWVLPTLLAIPLVGALVILLYGASAKGEGSGGLDDAAAMFARATSACAGSNSSVTSRPPGGSARASQMGLYPPSVPSSRIRCAPRARARTCSSRPSMGDTAIAGRPASSDRAPRSAAGE